jgi:hypothetical protein
MFYSPILLTLVSSTISLDIPAKHLSDKRNRQPALEFSSADLEDQALPVTDDLRAQTTVFFGCHDWREHLASLDGSSTLACWNHHKT